MTFKKFEQHPLSKIFPEMRRQDYRDLRDSIEQYGQLDTATVYEEQIVDGWHRYLVSVELGSEFKFMDLPEDIDPVDFVRAKNGKGSGRHLTAGQILMTEVLLSDWHRNYLATKTTERGEKHEAGAALNSSDDKQTDKPEEPKKADRRFSTGKTEEQIAADSESSVRSVRRAKRIIKAGIADQVINGDLTLTEADKVAAAQGQPKKKSKDKAKTQAQDLKQEHEHVREENRKLKLRVKELEDEMNDMTVELQAMGSAYDPEIYEEVKAGLLNRTALTNRIDSLMNENADLKREIKYLRKPGRLARRNEQ